jgi:hypothetical protein
VCFHVLTPSCPLQLKLLTVVIKNLSDPVKAQDPKYRLLRLENEKIKSKILPCPSSLDYLRAIGFAESTDANGEKILKIEGTVDIVLMKASLNEVTAGLNMVEPKNSAGTSVKKARTSYVEEKKTDDTPLTRSSVPEQLTEKQKARILNEEKEKREKGEAKRQRAKTAALIKTDKYVRENDENWTSGVSAAAAKGGKVMSTFRDQFGEE